MALNFGSKKESIPWPEDENGEPVPPVFLRHIHGGPLDMELTLNVLEAYGIPHVNQYPNEGLFGKLILGYPPGGMDVYVPGTMLEDAQNILAADIEFDDAGDELADSDDGADGNDDYDDYDADADNAGNGSAANGSAGNGNADAGNAANGNAGNGNASNGNAGNGNAGNGNAGNGNEISDTSAAGDDDMEEGY